MSFGFPRTKRLTRGADIQRVSREGKRIRTTHLEVRVTASPLAFHEAGPREMRLGLVVPRFKHTAVARNQLKRRLRELGRLHLLPLMLPCDVLVRVRPDAYDASFEMLRAEVHTVSVSLAKWFA